MKYNVEQMNEIFPCKERVEKWMQDPRLQGLTEAEVFAELKRREEKVQQFFNFLSNVECASNVEEAVEKIKNEVLK